MFYHQYAVKKTLLQVERDLYAKGTQLEGQLKTIKILALINNKLYNLISFPTLLHLMAIFDSAIVVPCMILFHIDKEGWVVVLFAIHPILSWSYITYLAQMNRQIVHIFYRICAHYKQRSAFELLGLSRRDGDDEKREDRSIRTSQLELYGKYFEMRLFQLAQIDSHFVFCAGLLALNYVVFLSQTK